MKGKRKKVKWIIAIKNNSEEKRLLLIWFLIKKNSSKISVPKLVLMNK